MEWVEWGGGCAVTQMHPFLSADHAVGEAIGNFFKPWKQVKCSFPSTACSTAHFSPYTPHPFVNHCCCLQLSWLWEAPEPLLSVPAQLHTEPGWARGSGSSRVSSFLPSPLGCSLPAREQMRRKKTCLLLPLSLAELHSIYIPLHLPPPPPIS